MITSIVVNYEARGVLGERESRSDRRTYDITAKWVDKAIEFVMRKDTDLGYKVAHFGHDDGSNDCIWQEYADQGTRRLHWRHDASANSHDVPVMITAGEFKRLMKRAVA